MPECRLHGFDASEVILRKDRERARREGLTNLRFGLCRLPKPPAGTYDLVTCIATIHYLSRPEQAIQGLYGIVRRGGHLIFNYPNRIQRERYRKDALRDPSVATRFSLILVGRNLLTHAAIERTLEARVEDFWSSVSEPTQKANPCVVVAK
jgi:SAM-dependent methyltransferase